MPIDTTPPPSRPAQTRNLVLGAASVLALLLAGCTAPTDDPTTGPTTEPAAQPVAATIGLTFVPNIQFAPFYTAETDGLLPDGVTLRHHGSAEGLFTALAAGQEQFVVAGGDEILQARADGTDVVAVSAYYRRYPARVIVPADSPIQTLADLKGHSVGLPGRFGENWFALLLALDQAGLTEDDVDIQEIGYTQQTALQTGKVDATIGFANSDAVTFEQSGFPVRLIDPDTALISICLATTQAFADAHPDVVEQVVAATSTAIGRVVADQAGALDVAAPYIPDFEATRDSSRAVLEATAELWTDEAGEVVPALDAAKWRAMASAMADAGLIPTADAADQGMTTAFV
jgi:NitT/TauT family transport system substrate-binding protein